MNTEKGFLTLIYMEGGGGGFASPPGSFLLQLKNSWRWLLKLCGFYS